MAYAIPYTEYICHVFYKSMSTGCVLSEKRLCYKLLAAISVRCTCLICKYSCANSPSAQTSTRIYWQCASYYEIYANVIYSRAVSLKGHIPIDFFILQRFARLRFWIRREPVRCSPLRQGRRRGLEHQCSSS